MLTGSEQRTVERRLNEEHQLLSFAEQTTASPGAANPVLERTGEAPIRSADRVSRLVRRPSVSLRELLTATLSDLPEASDDAWTSVEIEVKYEGYLERERQAARKLKDLVDFQLPEDLPYLELASLSTEGRIPGISPSDLQNLVLEVVRSRQQVA
jgi:tRNA uridine 5-carboxymethylaminomethyl modification enzyme